MKIRRERGRAANEGKRDMKSTYWRAAALAATLLPTGYPAAADVATGTRITKDNIDMLMKEAFEGEKIGDLLPERVAWQIRNHGLTVTLKTSEPALMDPRQIAKTEKYAGTVTLDSTTRELTNYRSGIPFPDLDPTDPDAGTKAVWNFYYGAPSYDIIVGRFSYVLIDARSGLDRTQEWWFRRYFMASKNSTPQDFEGDGSVLHKTLLYAMGPQDVKGLGTFSIRYMEPKLDDIWAYIRTVRRIRRLSGGAWVDPIGGTDELQDDIVCINAHPTWYEGYKLLGKRKMLMIPNSRYKYETGSWIEGAGSAEAQFPHLDFANAPHWNVHDTWEPREVWIVEGTTPVFHPYSRKIIYIDAVSSYCYMAEAYDRKGEFWKWMSYASSPVTFADGSGARSSQAAWLAWIDFQRMHATHIGISKEHYYNPPNLSAADFTLTQLESAGR